jgi:hypothetical protein
MLLGLSMIQFIALHVGISLVAIVSGLVALPALAAGRWLNGTQALFLWTTLLTTLTGFLFPFNGFTPAIGTGIVSTMVLAVAFAALYVFGRKGRWASVYAVTATIGLWLNLFVLVVQSFLKIPALNALAPAGNEPPFLVAQVTVLAAAVVLGWLAVRKSKSGVPAPVGM